MKNKILLSFVVSTLFLSACKKDWDVIKPVLFTETTYETLGTWDNMGKPNYLVTKDIISPALLSFLKNTLPEYADLRKSKPDLFKETASADIKITQPSDVYITFVSQGTEYPNTIAYYTYQTSQPLASSKDIKTITYIFPNSGKTTPLQAGDKVKIGRFSPGTSVGFVLLKGAWNATNKKPEPANIIHFCSNDILNPEVNSSLKKHAVLIDYTSENKVLIGFEDLERTTAVCDHDFNDVVIYATVTP